MREMEDTIMKKGLTEVVFILDRSGSMGGLEKDTIGGFNSMLQQQRNGEGEVLISTVLFDNIVEVLHDRVDIAKVEPMNENQYFVRGCTALLDAIGESIHHIGNIHKYAREEDRPEKTLFIITTDGMENASERYTYDKIKEMIERQEKKYHWEFLFFGANIDAIQVARRFGIDEDCTVNYECDSEGTRLNYQVFNRAVSMTRAAKSAAHMSKNLRIPEFLQPIREDYEKRGKKKISKRKNK